MRGLQSAVNVLLSLDSHLSDGIFFRVEPSRNFLKQFARQTTATDETTATAFPDRTFPVPVQLRDTATKLLSSHASNALVSPSFRDFASASRESFEDHNGHSIAPFYRQNVFHQDASQLPRSMMSSPTDSFSSLDSPLSADSDRLLHALPLHFTPSAGIAFAQSNYAYFPEKSEQFSTFADRDRRDYHLFSSPFAGLSYREEHSGPLRGRDPFF